MRKLPTITFTKLVGYNPESPFSISPFAQPSSMSSMNVIISPTSNESSSSLLATYLNAATNCFVFGLGFSGAGGGGYK